jgi:hypothetical protein
MLAGGGAPNAAGGGAKLAALIGGGSVAVRGGYVVGCCVCVAVVGLSCVSRCCGLRYERDSNSKQRMIRTYR